MRVTATEFACRGHREGSEFGPFSAIFGTSHLPYNKLTCTVLGTYFVLYCTTSAFECVFGTLRSRAIQFCMVQMHGMH